MMYPLVQFTDAPATTATVRFDFNDGTAWPEHDAFDLGAPTLDGDPDGVGVEYGLRTLSFSVVIEGPRSQALAKQSALAGELLRRDNWLLFQLDEYTAPVWFRTFRTQPGAVSLENVYAEGDGVWRIGVELAAEPFAYGERVEWTGLTAYHDPTQSPTGMQVPLPDPVLGDAPAPARITVDPWGVDENVLFATVAGSPGQLHATLYPEPSDADSAPVTLTGTGDTDVIGTGVQVTYATNAGWASRAYFSGMQGRHRVLLRVRATGSASNTYGLRLAVSGSLPRAYVGEERTITVTGGKWAWVDLGLISEPYGAAWDEAVTDLFWGSAGDDVLEIEARRTAGTNNMYMDLAYFVPVDDPGVTGTGLMEVAYANHKTSGGTPNVYLVDGDHEVATVAVPYGGKFYMQPTSFGTSHVVRGGFPTLVPGPNSSVFVIRNLYGSFMGNSQYDYDTLTVSYHPRWLWVGGGSAA